MTGGPGPWPRRPSRRVLVPVLVMVAALVLAPAAWREQASQTVGSLVSPGESSEPTPTGSTGPVVVDGYVPSPEERRRAQDAWLDRRAPVPVPVPVDGDEATSP